MNDDTRPACDVCGHPATTTNITGTLCDNDTCYATAWDNAFEVSA